jgi:hypothetical protein
VIDNCVLYGYSGKKDNAISCTNGVNTRTITCASGYYAMAGSAQGPGANATQYTKGIPYITLTGSTPFEGCAGM